MATRRICVTGSGLVVVSRAVGREDGDGACVRGASARVPPPRSYPFCGEARASIMLDPLSSRTRSACADSGGIRGRNV